MMTYCAPTTFHNWGCRSTDWSASSISGRYSLDADRDNTERNGSGFDAGLAGKKVFLLDGYGRVVASTVTGSDGSYKFAQLKAGTYQVAFESIAGTSFAQKDIGDGRFDSDVNAAGRTGCFTLSKCQNLCDIDASVQRDVGRITGSVFADIGCDGINGQVTQVPGHTYVMEAEAMCRSGSLGIYAGAEASGGKFVKLACGTTGSLSDRFDGKTGTYDVILRVQDENDGHSTIKLRVDGVLVEAVRLDRGTDGQGSDHGGFSDFVISGVQIRKDAKIELVIAGDAGEFVRLDKVTFQGAPTTTLVAEPPKAGVKIVLLNAAGDVVASTLTDASGNYAFNDVEPGQYRVMGEAPDGTRFTLQDQGSNDAIDSDVGADGRSGLITVTKGSTADIDLGLCKIKPGALEGRYFFDAARDNTDNGDAGVAGKTVTLYAADGVTVLATTLTDADGFYAFADLAPGAYVVGFQDSAAEGRAFVAANVGSDDTIDSDAVNGLTGAVQVLEGLTTKDVDVGVYLPNEAPIAADDAAKTCADETVTIDLLANDSDPDGNAISVVSIFDADEVVTAGGTLTLASGAKVTLNADGTVVFDGVAAYADLLIGEKASDGFGYTITDGEFTASAEVDVSLCGALNTPETIDARMFQGATANFTLNSFTLANAIDGLTITLNSVSLPNNPALIAADFGAPQIAAAYCLDYDQKISFRLPTEANVRVATEANAAAAGLANASNIDSVNWLLNQNFTSLNNGDGGSNTYTDLEVQEAIYILMKGDTFFINNPGFPGLEDNNNGVREASEEATEQNAMEIAMRALAEGDGFVAKAGDLLGLILDPTAPAQQDQPFIFAAQFNLFAEDCLCA